MFTYSYVSEILKARYLYRAFSVGRDMAQTVAEIRARLQEADYGEFKVLERSLKADTRKGVQTALEAARKRIAAEQHEKERLFGLYEFEKSFTDGKLAVGLDEVRRGPLAGPLSVSGVVFPVNAPLIEGLNDSKQVPEHKRDAIAKKVKECALAWSVVHVEPEEIDALGMSAALKMAFTEAVRAVEQKGIIPEVILLDGNPLHFDPREVNIIKGDSKCASIAAASLVAKTTRDAVMIEYDKLYPGYDFKSSKGYGSKRHRDAIEKKGLCPIHRKSFCRNYLQESLFS